MIRAGDAMTMLTEAEVKRVLSVNGRGQRLRDAYLKAWQTFEEKYPDRAWWRRKGTRAGLIWEYAVQYAIEGLGDDVQIVSHHDTASLIFDGLVLVRIKKADTELKSRNYPTPLATLFHEPEADLFGFIGYQRVEVVYVLDQFETKIDWVGIVARDNDRIAWHFELEDEAVPALGSLDFGGAGEARPAAELAQLKKDVDDDTKSDESK
jgi:hypothetical protein